MICYFARVSLNGLLFGVARREDILAVGFPAVIGGDWLLIASIAAAGRIRSLADVHVHRSVSGLGSDPSRLADSFAVHGFAARHHHALVAARLWRDIALGVLPLDRAGIIARGFVATNVAALVLLRFTLSDLARDALGERHASDLEARVSAWLRARDSGLAQQGVPTGFVAII